MALVTTPGSPTADSYGTLADFKTYTTNMGLDYGTVADDALEADMRRATAYLDRTYKFIGTRAQSDQALQWPRLVTDNDDDGFNIPDTTIPQQVIDAQFEVAFVYASGNDLLAYNDGAEIKVSEVKAGPVSSKTEYVSGSQENSEVAAIGHLLSGYVVAGSGTGSGFTRVSRA